MISLIATELNFGLAAGCLIWIPVAVGLVAMVGWMIQGEVDAAFGLICVIVLVTMGGLALVAPNQKMAPYLLIGAFSLVVLFPFVRSQKDKRELARIDLDQLEKAYDELKKNPRNVGARFRVAKLLHSRGIVDQAIVLAEESLKNVPRGVFEEEAQTLKKWKRQPIPQPVRGIHCLMCGHKNKAGTTFCMGCNGPLLLYYARGQWINPNLLKRVLLVWMALIVPLLGMPISRELLDPNKSVIISVFLLSISAVLVVLAVMGFKDANA